MSELTPYNGALAKLESRRVSRELARLGGQGRLELARIDLEADLQAERVSAIAYVGRRGMHEVAMLSELESQLCALAPTATARLQGIANVTALSIAETVSQTVRRVK